MPAALLSAIGQARLYSFDTAVAFTNFSTSADIVGWNNTLAQAFGVGGRASNLGLGTSDGYAAFYIPPAGTGGNTAELIIDRLTTKMRPPSLASR